MEASLKPRKMYTRQPLINAEHVTQLLALQQCALHFDGKQTPAQTPSLAVLEKAFVFKQVLPLVVFKHNFPSAFCRLAEENPDVPRIR